jgi:uncharacterized tellurite resistance protein B-like protein
MVPHATAPHAVVISRIMLLKRENTALLCTVNGYSKKLTELRRAVAGSVGRLRGRLMTLSGKEGPEPEAEGMTPQLAFAVSLIYCVAVDREVDAREVGRLVSAFGGKVAPDLIEVGASCRTLFHRAVEYVQTHESDDFLAEATPFLTRDQRLCILLNMADSVLADSKAEPAERRLFAKFQQAFGIQDERFRPLYEAILLKNDLKIFGSGHAAAI